MLPSRGLRWQARLDMEVLHEDNVFESLTAQQADNSSRLSVHFKTASNLSTCQKLHLTYQGGLEGHQKYSRENRFIQHASLGYTLSPFKNVMVGLYTQDRWRKFFQEDRGYHWIKPDIYLQVVLPYGWIIRGTSSLAWVRYFGTDWFDFNSRSDGLTLIWHRSSKFQIFSGYFTELMKFERTAYGYDYMTPEGNFLPKNEKQRNLVRHLSFGFEWMGWLLCRMKASYEWQFSNSYGYEYEQPVLELMLVKLMPWSLTMRFYGRYQNKQYLDSLDPFQISPYIESEENTRFLCDLIRDFPAGRSLRLRAGWYRNESPFRNLYYEKTMFSIGFSQTF